MKLQLLLIIGFLFVANSFSQVEVVNKETISTVSKKNPSGTFIADKNFSKTLLNKEFNTTNDLNVVRNSLSFSWTVLNKKNKCTTCNEFYANISPQWHNDDFVPSQVVMRYVIRPSSNSITISYDFAIEDANEANQLLFNLEEVTTGKILTLNKHITNTNTTNSKTIQVVPGRSYYLDIIANYTSKNHNTSFSVDNINVIENIKQGTIVLSNLSNITYVD